ncbi:DUF4230 domain-containing protein [Maribacter sp. X9]|uniref:DUF4230 domain-containing protein n=1 Tax=Maribacter sp. X9 TaxID=3402159 RepID=UPI003AF3D08C
MDNIFDTVLGLVLGAIGMYWLFNFFKGKKTKEVTTHQSTILLEKMRSVCKLISVEGEFAEIYKYENVKDFMSLVSSKKKALVVIKAKAHIGYDLSKLLIHADEDKKQIVLDNFPQPEVLSIEPELEFYDIKSGFFNFFVPEDLTRLNLEAKKHILEKIPESGLMDTARKEALQTVLIMEKIVETIGWKLDYTALQISQKQIDVIEKN